MYKKNRKKSEWVLTIWEGRGTANGGRNGTGSIGSVEWDGCLGSSGDDERSEWYGSRVCGWNANRKCGRVTERGVGCGAAERGGGGGGDGDGANRGGSCRRYGGCLARMQLGVACDDEESKKDQGEHDAREQEKKEKVAKNIHLIDLFLPNAQQCAVTLPSSVHDSLVVGLHFYNINISTSVQSFYRQVHRFNNRRHVPLDT